ncbi:biotin-dependent carboxyltransferase family protein [Dyella telluris]|uniref:Biotin-dependent carboxyltransferase family protein n=1 Tax=Dyella telluris TaxID=2763498 RepID=A0A7G8Q9Y6_9GAMM|nr:biotin-dependent carboxyltransferase family protein [Dyella telluris]QNK03594.1 biotin-dependent carboxyltransferase family protein [Dyella telluris]
MSIEVIKPGLLSSLQDAGRRGYASLGLGRAGVMDEPAWRLANALVGNHADEAALEITLAGPTLQFTRDAVIALTGGIIEARANGQTLPPWTRCFLPAGTQLRLGGMRHGCRSYLAVRGGFDVEPVLGSRSTDLHAHVGPLDGRALQAGDTIAVGTRAPDDCFRAGHGVQALRWGLDPQPWLDYAGAPFGLLRGHHYDALDEASQRSLFVQRFTVSKDSNRTGSRMDGQALQLARPLELVSEATLPGTLQLPPSGQPILLLAEAPVTGGYPRIGQLATVDLPRLAQRRPGDTVCFREITMDEALQRLRTRNDTLRHLLQRIAQRLEPA